MSWMDSAACKGMVPTNRFELDIFFGPEDHPETAEAIRVCAGCPVAGQCRDYALRHDLDGVWGGLTARQRARVRQGRPAGPRYRDRPQFSPCGTKTARERHRRRGESCDTCDATRLKPARCGTRSGHYRHRQEGTDPCDPCREVERAYQRERHQRRKAERGAA